jgi:YihY family inner membrane protein
VPDGIAKPVLGTLTQFAAKANRLGSAGLVFLLVSALALMLTIDRTLNAIWRVRKPRPIAQRVLVYWAAITLGPLLLGMSLTLSSFALTASRGIVDALPGGLALALQTLEFALLMLATSALFRYVPNTDVRWRHALAGGRFVSVGFGVAKRALAWYVGAMPGISMIYGAFATVPILLLWIYLSWLIVLFGAVIAAYAPACRCTWRARRPGQRCACVRCCANCGRVRAAARPDDRAVRLASASIRCRWSLCWSCWYARLGRAARRRRRQAPRAAVRCRQHPRRAADRPAAAGPGRAHPALPPARGAGPGDAGRADRRLRPALPGWRMRHAEL